MVSMTSTYKANTKETMRFKGLTSINEACFSCFLYIATIRLNEFKKSKLQVSNVLTLTQEHFGYCGGFGAVSLFVNRSATFAVFKSTFGFSYVLFVTVVTLYHVYNVIGVAVNAMINLVSLVELIVYLVGPSLM